MRQIKFRAWNSMDKEMMYGVWLSSDGSVIDFEYGNVVGTYPKDQVIPLQYTGLKDLNGTEIYEGDIVRIYGGEYWYGYWEVDIRGEVVFDVFSFGVKSKDRFYPFNYAFEPYDHKIKVIGNIYEDPELLEGEK